MNITRKALAVLTTLLCLACLTSCDISSKKIKEKDNDVVRIWTDEETGVQYVIYRESSLNGYAGFGGITPRLNADGSLYGAKTDEKE